MPRLARDLITVFAALAVGTVAALALGADSLGIALTFGQIAFAGAVFWVMIRR